MIYEFDFKLTVWLTILSSFSLNPRLTYTVKTEYASDTFVLPCGSPEHRQTAVNVCLGVSVLTFALQLCNFCARYSGRCEINTGSHSSTFTPTTLWIDSGISGAGLCMCECTVRPPTADICRPAVGLMNGIPADSKALLMCFHILRHIRCGIPCHCLCLWVNVLLPSWITCLISELWMDHTERKPVARFRSSVGMTAHVCARANLHRMQFLLPWIYQ